jgi:hypothetical protein
MRRLFAVLVGTAAMVVVGAGSAPSEAILCPLAHGAAVPGCCGPPVAMPDATPCCAANLPTAGQPCCPANGPCTVPLTISAGPNPSNHRDQVTISGRLLAGQAGTDVALWEELPGQTQFATIAHTATDAMGNYTFTQTPATDRRWYVTSGNLQSTTIDQWVSAQVNVTASTKRRAQGRIVELWGNVAPSQASGRCSPAPASGPPRAIESPGSCPAERSSSVRFSPPTAATLSRSRAWSGCSVASATSRSGGG